MKRPEWKAPDWLTWPVLLSIAIIVGGGYTSGGRALWVFAANEKVGGLTVPAAGVGILALGLYTYFLVTKPSALAGIGAILLALAFGLLSFTYCGFQSLLGKPMQGYADFVMALLPEMAMVLGGVVLGLALRTARQEREARERKAAQAAQAEVDNDWRSLEQENERKRLANERYAMQNTRLELKAQAGVLRLTETHTQTKRMVVSGQAPHSGAYVCTCGRSFALPQAYSAHVRFCSAYAEKRAALTLEGGKEARRGELK